MAEFNAAECLNLRKAKLRKNAGMGLTSDVSLTLVWENIPVREGELARAWAYSNRLTLTSPEIEYKTYTGTWRSIQLEVVPQTGSSVSLEHTFAYGYITTIATDPSTWTEARLTEDRVQQQVGNTDGDT